MQVVSRRTVQRVAAQITRKNFIKRAIAVSSSAVSISSPLNTKYLREYSTAAPQQSQEETKELKNTPQEQTNKEEIVTKEAAEPQTKSVVDKIKLFIKKYGLIGVVVYFGIYFLTLGLLYVALSNKWINADKVIHWIKDHGLSWLIDTEDEEQAHKAQKATTFAVAWVLAKVTEPLRFALTIAVTPGIVKLFRRLRK